MVVSNVITIMIKHPFQKREMPPLCLALGFFDGVHKGHKAVISKAKEEAEQRNLKSGVMTFFPHPKEVLRKETKVDYLTSMEEKEQLMKELGIDYLFVVHFDLSFSELNPQQFVDQYLIQLNVKHVVAGFDYTYGRLGKGTMETLPFHSRNKLTYTTVDKVESDGNKISSTNIRQALGKGDISVANKYLGRTYESSGIVVNGDKRGRTIGFPTANVQVGERAFIPNTGVYIVRIMVNNKWYNGVCNIGFKPTFHDTLHKPTIEVHIFRFDKNIYGEHVKVQWHRKIRNEMKFASVDELVSQLQLDVTEAEVYFQVKNEIKP
ncbi:riboflavin biosynthesis protein RibF [Evansella sp. AB-rgal1]|uniref:riboflavin biosynthesis protein RibF n=1 Tax=Evansella sp. AB-rgal1 TaxID=3242696 RepID=UPI00359D8089